MKVNLTKQQVRVLDRCAQFVLVGEWPWDDISPSLLMRAIAALRDEQSPTSVETDLSRAIGLLHLANPGNRAWREARDAFLEEMGAFKEPPE